MNDRGRFGTLNRLSINFNNVESVKTLAADIKAMTPPASDKDLTLVKNVNSNSAKLYVLSMPYHWHIALHFVLQFLQGLNTWLALHMRWFDCSRPIGVTVHLK